VNVELKRFTTNARLSQETTAFAADVWIDGKKAGTAENDGRGGSTLVRLDPSVRGKVESYGQTLVPAEYKGCTGGAEWIVDQLVEAELQKRSDREFAKKIAKADAKEKAACDKQGLHAARLRHGDTWLWFAFKTGADPKKLADAIAAKHQTLVDDLVVLS
jgi:hypothetical protein